MEIHTEDFTDDTGRTVSLELAELDDGGWHWRLAGWEDWDPHAYYTKESAREAAKAALTT